MREYLMATASTADHVSLAALQDILKRVREFLKMDIAFVAEFVDGRRVFRQVDAHQPHQSFVTAGDSHALEDTYCQRAIDGRLPLAIPNSRRNKEARELAATDALQIGCYLTAPIVLEGGVVYGTLCCYSHEPKDYLGQSEVAALEAVAKLFTQAISKDRALYSR